MNTSRAVLSASTTRNLSEAVCRSFAARPSQHALRATCRVGLHAHRCFSTGQRNQIEFFPAKPESDNIKKCPAEWPHPQVTSKQLNSVEAFVHRETRTWSDKVAFGMVRCMRFWTDLFTGYSHDESKPYSMNERKWFVRFIFLETVAGVPGMTAGMLRHFRSLRRLERDNGWLGTLLEEAYNERMHLLTFMKMAEPGWFMKMMILGAQGVFANGFFLAYLVSPATCHRFVGYLEEEATNTYTLAIEDLDKGRLPQWNNLRAPDIAINYWKMPEGHQTMRDLLLYIRADEAKHRELNHTLGNLDQNHDPNPFVSEYQDPSKPHPSRGFENMKSKGWEREDVV